MRALWSVTKSNQQTGGNKEKSDQLVGRQNNGGKGMSFLKDDDLDTGEDLPIHAPQPPKPPKPTSHASTNNSSLIHLNANAQLLSLLARHFGLLLGSVLTP